MPNAKKSRVIAHTKSKKQIHNSSALEPENKRKHLDESVFSTKLKWMGTKVHHKKSLVVCERFYLKPCIYTKHILNSSTLFIIHKNHTNLSAGASKKAPGFGNFLKSVPLRNDQLHLIYKTLLYHFGVPSSRNPNSVWSNLNKQPLAAWLFCHALDLYEEKYINTIHMKMERHKG